VLALGGAAAGVMVAVVLVLAQFLTSSPQPATGSAAQAAGGSHTSAPVTPGQAASHPDPSAEATSSAPAARAPKPTPLAAINQLWRSVHSGAADGDIRDDVARDFENLIGPVRAELIAGEPAPVASLVPALRQKLAARLGEGGITAGAAQVLGNELTRLADSAHTDAAAPPPRPATPPPSPPHAALRPHAAVPPPPHTAAFRLTP
jgi:hypothetical protein